MPIKKGCSEQCREMLTVSEINHMLSVENTSATEKIAGCFYSCWYSSFLSGARIIYSSYAAGYITEMADQSFTDAMLAFMQKAAKDGLYERVATAKSIAFTFFRNKLHEMIRNDKTKVLINDDHFPDQRNDREEDNMAEMLRCLEKIKLILTDEDNAICKWKFTEKQPNSEIARRLNITTNSFTNRLYRLTGRMEKLMNGCLQSETS